MFSAISPCRYQHVFYNIYAGIFNYSLCTGLYLLVLAYVTLHYLHAS